MTHRCYHGTRTELSLRDLIAPAATSLADDRDPAGPHVLLTTNLDEAIWSAELADGDAPPRVYVVEPLGRIAPVSQLPGYRPPGHPAMSLCSREPLRVTGEVEEWLYYHGTRADLATGDLLEPGHVSNFGANARKASYIYFARTLDAATWGAELAVGEGRGRIYIVEPTGPIEEDPNLTDKKFRGNPTKSFRSRRPLRIAGEVADWQGHGPGAIQAMKENIERLARLARLGVEAIDD
jgi:rifampin ADP-ribosylating transferase